MCGAIVHLLDPDGKEEEFTISSTDYSQTRLDPYVGTGEWEERVMRGELDGD